MQLKETYEALNKFGKYLVQQSRSNLTRGNKNVSKALYNDLDYNIEVGKESFLFSFKMPEYGIYQDSGVSGTEKKYNTPFSYKSKMPPIKPLSDWAKARNIRLRDDKGRFQKGNYKTIGFLIARSIQKKGIKPSLFFTRPFEKAFKNLPKELIEAFALDTKEFLEYTLKDGKDKR